ncbi:conserved hypothetical protein [Thermotomaculum hydrothermale]|uniref:Porin n=1 Tax=Thermotomaculum hydrothermale TaxID=981385 RepID=A0A7R6SZ14_9BACT|nr:putative porin [Thermotomaculum hydrothermale]BBB33374.1 conserved hypothetical protein [Thermotomaculum hydrothermale]
MKKKFLLIAMLIMATGVFAQSLPSWITNTKLNGKFRLREEFIDQTDKVDRDRTRIQFKLGITTKINAKIDLGIGIATGSGDPRSQNVTLGDSDSSKELNLYYAFIQYKATDNLKIWGGKFKGIKKAIFIPSNFLWDYDIAPEGVGLIFNKKLTENLRLFFNASYIVVDEYKDSGADPFVYIVQPGLIYKKGDFQAKLGIAYMSAVHETGNLFEYSSHSNTYENGVLKYGYSVLNPNIELKWKIDGRYISFFKLFGEYASNSDADNEDSAYTLGLAFGKKIKSYGDFSFSANYRYLEKDVWLDIFPDSDAFSGKTDAKGLELEFKYGLMKNVYLSIDYYDMKRIIDNSQSQKRFQFDINLKF